MPVGEICNRDTVIVKRDDTVADAAQLMRQHHVGDVHLGRWAAVIERLLTS